MRHKPKISDLAHAAVDGSQPQEDLVRRQTAGFAVIDYAVLAFVLASVAFGPMLVWVLLWAAHWGHTHA
jgi:hypothetical protein